VKLSDVMSNAGLAVYAEAGLVLFLLVFVAVSVRLFRRGVHEEFSALSRLPLSDDSPVAQQDRA